MPYWAPYLDSEIPMFMTLPQFEQAIPLALMPKGGRCWRAMELSFNHHWYFLTMRSDDDGISLARNLILSSDRDLVDLLRTETQASFVSLELAMPPDEAEGGWKFQRIQGVWMAFDIQAPRREFLVLEAVDGTLIEPSATLNPSRLDNHQLLLDLA